MSDKTSPVEMITGHTITSSTGKTIVFDPFPKSHLPFRALVDLIPIGSPGYSRFQNAVTKLTDSLKDPRFGVCTEIQYILTFNDKGATRPHKTQLLNFRQCFLIAGKLSDEHYYAVYNYFFANLPPEILDLPPAAAMQVILDKNPPVEETIEDRDSREAMVKQMMTLETTIGMLRAEASVNKLLLDEAKYTAESATEVMAMYQVRLSEYNRLVEAVKPLLNNSSGELVDLMSNSEGFIEEFGKPILPEMDKVKQVTLLIDTRKIHYELPTIMETQGMDIFADASRKRCKYDVVEFVILAKLYVEMDDQSRANDLIRAFFVMNSYTADQIQTLIVVSNALLPLPQMKEGFIVVKRITDILWSAYSAVKFSDLERLDKLNK